MKTTQYIALATLLTGSASIANASVARNSTPSEMVGKWRWSTQSLINYENQTTGSIDGSGMSTSLTFTKDGRYTFNFYVKMRTYNLVSEANTYSEGTVTWKNGQFTLHPVKGHYLGWYNGKQKTNRDMTTAERQKNTQWHWKWDIKDNKRVLMMGMTPTNLSQFKREG
ncbi:hypothetical protein EON83_10740 [bacterium]|nr:MAG: hypothetical protein EON83_10740 [bacterium]